MLNYFFSKNSIKQLMLFTLFTIIPCIPSYAENTDEENIHWILPQEPVSTDSVSDKFEYINYTTDGTNTFTVGSNKKLSGIVAKLIEQANGVILNVTESNITLDKVNFQNDSLDAPSVIIFNSDNILSRQLSLTQQSVIQSKTNAITLNGGTKNRKTTLHSDGFTQITGDVGIYAKANSIVDLRISDTTITGEKEGILIDHGEISLSGNTQIISNTANGVTVNNSDGMLATINVNDPSTSISGKTGGIVTNGIVNIDIKNSTISSSAGNGIELNNSQYDTMSDNDNIKTHNDTPGIDTVKGINGIKITGEAKISLNEATRIVGTNDSGINLNARMSGTTDKVTIETHAAVNEVSIEGKNSGLSLNSGVELDFQANYTKIIGGNHGIHAKDNSYLKLTTADVKITGENGDGISLSAGELTLDDNTKIVGAKNGITALTENILIYINGDIHLEGKSENAIQLLKGGQVSIDSGKLTGTNGLTSSTNGMLELTLHSNAEIQGDSGYGVRLGKGNITLANTAMISGKTAGILLDKNSTNQPTSLSLSNAAQIKGEQWGIDAIQGALALKLRHSAKIHGQSGINMTTGTLHAKDNALISGTTSGILLNRTTDNQSVEINLTDRAKVNGDKIGIDANQTQLSLTGSKDSLVFGEQTGLLIRGDSITHINGDTQISSNNNTIQFSDHAKGNLTLAGAQNMTLTGQTIFNIENTDDMIVTMSKPVQFIITNGGNLFRTNNNKDVNFTFNSPTNTQFNTENAYGIYIGGQQQGKTSLTFNQLNLKSSGNKVAAININRDSTQQNSLKFYNSQISSINAPTLQVIAGHLAANFENSTLSSLTNSADQPGNVLEVAPTAENSQIKLHFKNSNINGHLTNYSDSAIVHLILDSHSNLKGKLRNINEITLRNSNWDVDENITIKKLTNSGHILFKNTPSNRVLLTNTVNNPTPIFNTLTVEQQYIGNNGLLHFNVAIDDNGAQADKLIVNGDTSGNSFVTFDTITGLGKKIIDGLELIQVNGVSIGEFILDRPYQAGAYNYVLRKGDLNNDKLGSWFLQSLVSSDIGAYLGNRNAAVALFKHSLQDRQGETAVNHNRHQLTSPVWLYATTGTSHNNAVNGELHLRTHITSIQLGGNIRQWHGKNNNIWQLGIISGFGEARTYAKNNSLEHTITNASGKIDGYTTGSYFTWFKAISQTKNLYWDNWLQYSWFKNSIRNAGTLPINYSSKKLSFSSELGYQFDLGKTTSFTWSIKPHAQTILYHYHVKRVRNALNEAFSGNNSALATRLGVRLSAKKIAQRFSFEPFFEVNWLYDSDTKDEIKIGNNNFGQNIPKNRYELKTGFNTQFASNWQSWLTINWQTSHSTYHYKNLQGRVGIQYSW